jgi:N-alpha-acetyl-L-2,4-diaminobutyrate deacetylase
MREAGLIDGEIVSLTPPGLDRQRVLKALDIDAWVTAPTDGIFEPVAPLGSFVHKGDLVARVHDFDRWDEPAIEVRADKDGYVMVRKFRAATKQGDVVMVIGEEVTD